MTIEEVSVDTLAAALEAGHRVVDVREADEYLAGHVPGAVHVALGDVPGRTEEFRSPAGVTTYVICKGGARSMHAAVHLAEHGIATVNVAGGTTAWMLSGRRVVNGDRPS